MPIPEGHQRADREQLGRLHLIVSNTIRALQLHTKRLSEGCLKSLTLYVSNGIITDNIAYGRIQPALYARMSAHESEAQYS